MPESCILGASDRTNDLYRLWLVYFIPSRDAGESTQLFVRTGLQTRPMGWLITRTALDKLSQNYMVRAFSPLMFVTTISWGFAPG
jgi:hypothetical protein